MLSCAEFLIEFGEYLEESADPQLRARLEEHLRECKTCQVIMDSTRKTIQIVTDTESFPLPGGNVEPLVSQVMARIRTKQQQKSAEAASEISQEIIKDAAEGIIFYDRELRYQLFNPFMERLTGKSAEEVLGRVAMEVFPRLRTSGLEEVLQRALSGETVQVRDILVPKHAADGRDVLGVVQFRAASGRLGSDHRSYWTGARHYRAPPGRGEI
jgi:PAS domain S-box-containing protein